MNLAVGGSRLGGGRGQGQGERHAKRGHRRLVVGRLVARALPNEADPGFADAPWLPVVVAAAPRGLAGAAAGSEDDHHPRAARGRMLLSSPSGGSASAPGASANASAGLASGFASGLGGGLASGFGGGGLGGGGLGGGGVSSGGPGSGGAGLGMLGAVSGFGGVGAVGAAALGLAIGNGGNGARMLGSFVGPRGWPLGSPGGILYDGKVDSATAHAGVPGGGPDEDHIKSLLGEVDGKLSVKVREVSLMLREIFQDANPDKDGLASYKEVKAIFARLGNSFATEVDECVMQAEKSGELGLSVHRFIDLALHMALKAGHDSIFLAMLAKKARTPKRGKLAPVPDDSKAIVRPALPRRRPSLLSGSISISRMQPEETMASPSSQTGAGGGSPVHSGRRSTAGQDTTGGAGGAAESGADSPRRRQSRRLSGQLDLSVAPSRPRRSVVGLLQRLESPT